MESHQINTQYYCSICNTKPDQLSHHKAHLKTQKHIYKRKCFETCVNMFVFHFHNNQTPSEIIQQYEDDTNTTYDRVNVQKLREWRLNRESMLKNEYPNSIIPDPDTSNESPDFLEKWLTKIVSENETVVLKPIKSTISKVEKQEIIKTFKQEVEEQPIELLFDKAIETINAFDVAMILYKLNCDKYSFKSFVGNVWIDKSDSTKPSRDIFNDIRNEITKIIKPLITTYMNKIPENLKFKCKKLIIFLDKSAFKNDVMRELRELFFDN